MTHTITQGDALLFLTARCTCGWREVVPRKKRKALRAKISAHLLALSAITAAEGGSHSPNSPAVLASKGA